MESFGLKIKHQRQIYFGKPEFHTRHTISIRVRAKKPKTWNTEDRIRGIVVEEQEMQVVRNISG